MRYNYKCTAVPEHIQEEKHGMMEDPEIRCVECGEVMKKMLSVPLYAGRTPDGGETIIQYLEHNRKRKKAGMPKFSPFKIKRPPE